MRANPRVVPRGWPAKPVIPFTALISFPSKFRMLGWLLLTATLVCGCSQSSRPAVHEAADASFKVALRQYAAAVFGAGTTRQYVDYYWIRERITIDATGSATVLSRPLSGPFFASPRDKERWKALGRPSLGAVPRGGSSTRFKPAQWTFLPTPGPPLTLQRLQHLGHSPRAVRASLNRFMYSATRDRSGALMLDDYAFLLRAAPLSPSMREAIVAGLRWLPQLAVCPRHPYRASTATGCLRAISGPLVTIAFFRRGRTERITQELRRRSGVLPAIPPGRPYLIDAFSS